MALHDLTPQLRTRLSRVERVVGLFVGLAALLLVAGFGYYLHHTAARKGWFLKKVPYYVYVQNASGLKPGDPVKMMGFDVGEITDVTATPPEEWFIQNHYDVFVRFVIKQPNYGYIWTDSEVKVTAGDFLGKRVLEVMKGQNGKPTVLDRGGVITGILSDPVADMSYTNITYTNLTRNTKGVWLLASESPVVTEKLDQIVKAVEAALPNLTNQLSRVLDNTSQVTSNMNVLISSAHPVATNLDQITAQLRDFNGALGRWMFPSNFNRQFESTVAAAGSAMTSVDTNLAMVVGKLSLSLDNLANLTSNLNAQVQVNTNMLSSISDAVVHTDQLVQGLKRHWLLKSAFKEKSTNRPPARVTPPMGSKR